MPNKVIKEYLQNFAEFSNDDWEMAKDFFKQEKIKKDDYFLKEGQYSQKIAFIESGLFRLFYQIDGEEKIMLFFYENQFMTDYFGYLTKTPSLRPIKALEDSLIYCIQSNHLKQLFNASKTWERLGRILAESAYITSVQRANRLIHDNYDTRFDSFLKENPNLLQRVPQYMIASYLDMTPETLSRVKKRSINKNIKGSVHKPL